MNGVKNKRYGYAFMAVWLFILLLLPVQAFGHATLTETEPAADARLDQPPMKIRLAFNQKLEALSPDAVQLKDDQGLDMSGGKAALGDDGKSVEIPAAENMQAGEYTVTYEVLSLDGHTVKGSYRFTINGAPAQKAAPEPAPEPAPVPEASEPQSEQPEEDEDHAHTPIVAADETMERESAFAKFYGMDASDYSHAAYYIVFLPLVGMVLWSVLIRGRTEEQSRRHLNWTLQLQRLHFLVLLGVVAEYVNSAAGFEDTNRIRAVLFETTSGLAWTCLLVLSAIGLFVIGRVKAADVVWLVAVIAAKTQIGHAAAADERITASLMTGIHLFSASLWSGGLLLAFLLWRKHRYEAEQLLPTFSGASLAAVMLLALSGLISSALYLPDLTYLLETRWGLLLIGKLILVCIVLATAAVIRRGYRRGVFRIGAWLKLDMLLMVLIASLAGLLTSSEPIPPNEPVHWHVMGEEVHMTADLTPMSPGTNNYGVTVWLPEGRGEPQQVEVRLLPGRSGDETIAIPLNKSEISEDTEFAGFTEYHYHASGEQLDQAGWWRIVIAVTDDKGQMREYRKTLRVY